MYSPGFLTNQILHQRISDRRLHSVRGRKPLVFRKWGRIWHNVVEFLQRVGKAGQRKTFFECPEIRWKGRSSVWRGANAVHQHDSAKHIASQF